MQAISQALLFFSLSAIIFVGRPVQAGEFLPMDPHKHPCHEEAHKICGGMMHKGKEEMKKCIEEHRSEFSPKCQNRMAEFVRIHDEWMRKHPHGPHESKMPPEAKITTPNQAPMQTPEEK